jgi:hypothetical protein
MHVILAHGALGPYDELIMGSAAVIFLLMMGISWVRSRNTRPDFEDEVLKEENQGVDPEKADEPDRFRLD